jgi:neutral ceramidase
VLIVAALLSAVVASMGATAHAAPAPDLRAGAATAVLPLPAGVPLAGYGSFARRGLLPDLFGGAPHAFWLKPAQGTRDPIMVRALVVETSAARLLWVAVDLIAVDATFVSDLTARLRAAGFGYSALIVSASHTHSGPGAFIDSELFGVLVMDRFDPSIRHALLDGIVQAATSAEQGKEPARVGTGRETAPLVTRSRLAQPLDSEIVLIKLVSRNGSPIALVWSFAIHGTVLGPRNLLLSGDVMGVASRALERALGVPVLFVNGAVADVSPAGHGEGAIDDLARRLADTVSAAATAVTPWHGGAGCALSVADQLPRRLGAAIPPRASGRRAPALGPPGGRCPR